MPPPISGLSESPPVSTWSMCTSDQPATTRCFHAASSVAPAKEWFIAREETAAGA